MHQARPKRKPVRCFAYICVCVLHYFVCCVLLALAPNCPLKVEQSSVRLWRHSRFRVLYSYLGKVHNYFFPLFECQSRQYFLKIHHILSNRIQFRNKSFSSKYCRDIICIFLKCCRLCCTVNYCTSCVLYLTIHTCTLRIRQIHSFWTFDSFRPFVHPRTRKNNSSLV